ATPGYPTLAGAHAALTALGDELVAERIPDLAAVRAVNERNNRLLATRASELARRVPEIAAALSGFLARQRRESLRLETRLFPALWLLQRGAGSGLARR
ncbi:MAG: hypothetical protein HY901_09365, partial [Deltaproteobacteria bacterium]|nr:hypothetical protein [Deltaproteobacteria bacterium]